MRKNRMVAVYICEKYLSTVELRLSSSSLNSSIGKSGDCGFMTAYNYARKSDGCGLHLRKILVDCGVATL
jgi:hypothetical protein